MSESDRMRTRSQKNISEMSEKEDGKESSSDSECLDKTIVAMDASNTDQLQISSPAVENGATPKLSVPTASFAADEVLNSLISTMTSLKFAIKELRQDAAHNNIEVANLRSQMLGKHNTSLPPSQNDPITSYHMTAKAQSHSSNLTPVPPQMQRLESSQRGNPMPLSASGAPVPTIHATSSVNYPQSFDIHQSTPSMQQVTTPSTNVA